MNPTKPAPLPALVEQKYVRVPDEDDDRHRRVGGIEEYANPRHVALRERLDNLGRYGGGWYPAINIRVRDMVPVYQHAKDFPGYAGHAGFFRASLYKNHDGSWWIVCSGGDDQSYARRNMDEATARRVWAALNHHVTIRTLRGRHGFQTW